MNKDELGEVKAFHEQGNLMPYVEIPTATGGSIRLLREGDRYVVRIPPVEVNQFLMADKND
jgi:hypothetical protein